MQPKTIEILTSVKRALDVHQLKLKTRDRVALDMLCGAVAAADAITGRNSAETLALCNAAFLVGVRGAGEIERLLKAASANTKAAPSQVIT